MYVCFAVTNNSLFVFRTNVINIEFLNFNTSFILLLRIFATSYATNKIFVKLRQGSGKDRQGMAPKAKGPKA